MDKNRKLQKCICLANKFMQWTNVLVFFHQWNWANSEGKFHLKSDTVISKDISGV